MTDTQNRIPADNAENRIARLIREHVGYAPHPWDNAREGSLTGVDSAAAAIAAELRTGLLDNVRGEIRHEVAYALELALSPDGCAAEREHQEFWDGLERAFEANTAEPTNTGDVSEAPAQGGAA